MLSHDLNEVGIALRTLLEQHHLELKLGEIYYGDTPLKADYPCVAIQSITLARNIKGTHKFQIQMEHEFVLSVFKMGDPKGREEQIHELVESVTELLDTDRTLGGLVLFMHVSEVNMVDVALGSILIRGATMTIQSLSEELF